MQQLDDVEKEIKLRVQSGEGMELVSMFSGLTSNCHNNHSHTANNLVAMSNQ